MASGKCGLGLIEDRRKRLQTFMNRKKGLEKKAYELSTLCDVNVAMIILGPYDVSEGSKDPIIWPEDSNVVRKMISLYQNKQKADQNCSRSVDIASICQDQARPVGKEIEKLMEQKIGDKSSYDQLLQFGIELDNVLEGVKSRIDSLKTYQMFQEISSYENRGKELDNHHQLQGLNTFDYFGNELAPVVHNSLTRKTMDESSSYRHSCNNIDPANLDYTMDEDSSYHDNCNNIRTTNLEYCCPPLPGFGKNSEQNTNNMIMDDNYNNIVTTNLDYSCPPLPAFGQNFEHMIMDEGLSYHDSYNRVSCNFNYYW